MDEYVVFGVEGGIIKGPTGGRMTKHIMVGSKSDFYEIKDGLEQFEEFPPFPE
jgi:hypothetical protein